MIRLRKTNGDVYELPPEVAFVELVNITDNSVGTAFMQPQPGMVLQIHPGTEDASKYEKLFRSRGVRFTPEMIHRDMTHGD